jgi:hypothetical protein
VCRAKQPPLDFDPVVEVDLWAVLTQDEREEFQRERSLRECLFRSGYPPRRHDELILSYAVACGHSGEPPSYWKK